MNERDKLLYMTGMAAGIFAAAGAVEGTHGPTAAIAAHLREFARDSETLREMYEASTKSPEWRDMLAVLQRLDTQRGGA